MIRLSNWYDMTQHHTTRHHKTQKIFFLNERWKKVSYTQDETKSHRHRMKQNLDLGWRKIFGVLWCRVTMSFTRHMCCVVSYWYDTIHVLCCVVSYWYDIWTVYLWYSTDFKIFSITWIILWNYLGKWQGTI